NTPEGFSGCLVQPWSGFRFSGFIRRLGRGKPIHKLFKRVRASFNAGFILLFMIVAYLDYKITTRLVFPPYRQIRALETILVNFIQGDQRFIDDDPTLVPDPLTQLINSKASRIVVLLFHWIEPENDLAFLVILPAGR